MTGRQQDEDLLRRQRRAGRRQGFCQVIEVGFHLADVGLAVLGEGVEPRPIAPDLARHLDDRVELAGEPRILLP